MLILHPVLSVVEELDLSTSNPVFVIWNHDLIHY